MTVSFTSMYCNYKNYDVTFSVLCMEIIKVTGNILFPCESLTFLRNICCYCQ